MLKVDGERFTIRTVHSSRERGDSVPWTINVVAKLSSWLDEELLCHVIRDMLTHLGYQVFGATSCQEALHVAQEYSGKIDVLITDVLLPGLAGPHLADSLRGSRPGLKVIFVSGDAEGNGVLGLGDALLQKPFSIKMLSAKLREVIQL